MDIGVYCFKSVPWLKEDKQRMKAWQGTTGLHPGRKLDSVGLDASPLSRPVQHRSPLSCRGIQFYMCNVLSMGEFYPTSTLQAVHNLQTHCAFPISSHAVWEPLPSCAPLTRPCLFGGEVACKHMAYVAE